MRLAVAVLCVVVGACGDNRAAAPVDAAPDPDAACLDEVCGNGLDEDCDGLVDEGCCAEGTVQACPDGSDVGSCRSGTQQCAGGAWGACDGRVEPVAETCNLTDDDCDGIVDGPAASSACAGGSICDEGACVALPRVRWTAELAWNAPSGVSIDEAGNAIVAGHLRQPLTVAGMSIDPFDSSPFPPWDVYLTSIDSTGSAQWLRRDGTGEHVEQVWETARGGSGGAIAAIGGVVGSTQLAGQTFTEDPPLQHNFLAVYGPDGSDRWLRVSQASHHFASPVVGDTGIDVVECPSPATSCVLRRLDPMGVERASVSLAVTSTGTDDVVALNPILQRTNGTVLVFGHYRGTLVSDCPGLPPSGAHAFVAAVDLAGGCTVQQVIDISGPAWFGAAKPWSTGLVIAASFTGSLTIGGSTVVSSGNENLLLAVDATGLAWSWRTTSTEYINALASDDHDNVYMFTFKSGQPGATARSLRRDGILRWELPFGDGEYVGPARYLAVNHAGAIAMGVPTNTPALPTPFHYVLYRIDGR